MSLFLQRSSITITCHKHISTYLAEEVRELGFEIKEQFITGVVVEGTLKDCIKLNLHLRCASQVLFLIHTFDANHPDDVYKNVYQIDWETYLPKDAYFSITSNVFTETINNNLYANLKVKDAIVDQLREKRCERPSTGSDLTGAVIHLHWKGDKAKLFLDTSGNSLGRHGYRKFPGRAPMLESLAAATIFASKWNKKSIVVNPMCGSGTIAIEAALMAMKKAPGFFRENYAFMHLQDYSKIDYLHEVEEMKKQVILQPTIQIIASDISRKAIETAEKNARAAGVEHLIRFEVCDFYKTTIPQENKGIIFLNPEYGERLGDMDELEKTYERIGDFLKQKCKGYYGYIFTANMHLAKKIGLKANRRLDFYNSKLECKLFEYELYDGSKKKVKKRFY